jgi:hypothetical protein
MQVIYTFIPIIFILKNAVTLKINYVSQFQYEEISQLLQEERNCYGPEKDSKPDPLNLQSDALPVQLLHSPLFKCGHTYFCDFLKLAHPEVFNGTQREGRKCNRPDLNFNPRSVNF